MEKENQTMDDLILEDAAAIEDTAITEKCMKEKEGEMEDKEEKEDGKEADKDKKPAKVEIYSEQVAKLLESNGELSEDFKTKATTIFEAAMNDRIATIQETIEQEYAQKLTEEVELVESTLTDKVDAYVSYVAEKFLEENKLAVESSMKLQAYQELVKDVMNVFESHNVKFPEQTDLLESATQDLKVTQEKLDEAIQVISEKDAQIISLQKEIALRTLSEGLTFSKAEKLKSLTESSIEAGVTLDVYKEKIQVIKESFIDTDEVITEASTVEATTKTVSPYIDQLKKLNGKK